MDKKGSAVASLILISILIVSSGLIITNEVGKEENIEDTEEEIIVEYPVISIEEGDEEDNTDNPTPTSYVIDVEDNTRSLSKSSSSRKKSSGSSQTSSVESFDVNSSNEEEPNDSGVAKVAASCWSCGSGGYESNEGPGITGDCPCSGDDQQCKNWFTQSTVHLGDFYGTDTCVGFWETLREYYLDCYGTDEIFYEDKDCNDFDQLEPEYYCTSNQLRKKWLFTDFSCSYGKCIYEEYYTNDQLIVQDGDETYCSEKIARCSAGCTEGQSDCDSDSECASGLHCSQVSGTDYCCPSNKEWSNTYNQCCECISVTDCCDGCNFKSTDVACTYLGAEFSCYAGSDPGDDVYRKQEWRYCPGDSAGCNGLEKWGSWEVYESFQFCK